MTVLGINKPFDSQQPLLLVENKLAVGRHRFALVVVNERGVSSDPVQLVVAVRPATVRGPLGVPRNKDPRHDDPRRSR